MGEDVLRPVIGPQPPVRGRDRKGKGKVGWEVSQDKYLVSLVPTGTDGEESGLVLVAKHPRVRYWCNTGPRTEYGH